MPSRVRFLLPVLVCLLMVPALAAGDSDYSYARVVRLSLVVGDVQISRPEEEGWQRALLNMPIQQGYALATTAGRAEVEFESGATLRLAEKSLLQFTEMGLANGARITQLTLLQGAATFYANLAREDSFSVLTPHLQVSIPENSRFRLDVDVDGTTLNVLKGEISVETRAGSQRLAKGQQLIAQAAEPDRVILARSAEPDDWDRWVADRDEVISNARAGSVRYVNAPFQYGLADLSSNGNWVSVPGYGHCWQPWGVPLGWSPYWNGRWMFVNGVGLTWVSYEPWGWLPYHFGRWALTNFGWVWVPGGFNQWQPGLVYWVQFGNFVGWGPLAPQDRRDQPPANLPHGTVVNTTRGLVGGAPNRFATLGNDPRRRIVFDPPDLDELRQRKSATGAGGGGNTATGTVGANPASAARTAEDKDLPRGRGAARGVPGVVFDANERKFVNDPAAPRREIETDVRQDVPVALPHTGTGVVGADRPAPRASIPNEAERGVSIGVRPPMVREPGLAPGGQIAPSRTAPLPTPPSQRGSWGIVGAERSGPRGGDASIGGGGSSGARPPAPAPSVGGPPAAPPSPPPAPPPAPRGESQPRGGAGKPQQP